MCTLGVLNRLLLLTTRTFEAWVYITFPGRRATAGPVAATFASAANMSVSAVWVRTLVTGSGVE